MPADAAIHHTRNILISALSAIGIVFLARVSVDWILPVPSPAPALPLASASLPRSEEVQDQPELDARAIIEAARNTRIERERQLAEEDRQRRKIKAEEALRFHESEAALARQEAEKREQAWQRFYKKPKKCDNPNDPEIIVECSNHYLREQQRFEKTLGATSQR